MKIGDLYKIKKEERNNGQSVFKLEPLEKEIKSMKKKSLKSWLWRK